MPRHLAEHLSLDRDPARRFLRAAGTPEDILMRGSDYDRFLALAAALPLAPGHTLAASLEREAQAATGLTLPLCPHTAPAFWEAWGDIHWYQRKLQPTRAPAAPCPLCAPAEPTVSVASAMTRLPDPGSLPATESLPDLAALTRCLSDRLPTCGGAAVLTLPSAADFCPPDPYHAVLALRAVSAGNATDKERACLLAQALRILGEVARARQTTLLLVGGSPEFTLELFAYLAACDRLPATVWLPDDPADVARVSGLYPQVRTGYVRYAEDPPAAIARKRETYAAHAPLGCGIELHV